MKLTLSVLYEDVSHDSEKHVVTVLGVRDWYYDCASYHYPLSTAPSAPQALTVDHVDVQRSEEREAVTSRYGYVTH